MSLRSSLLSAMSMVVGALYFTACNSVCGIDWQGGGVGNCRALDSNFSKSQIRGFGSCAGVPNSRQLQISCAAASGANSACTSRSNGSGYFAIVVPNNNGGSFNDSNYSVALGNGPIADCNTLWTAINAPVGSRPTDILAIYRGDPTAGESVTCTDVGGCSVTSANCFSGWDQVNQVPSGVAQGIANGGYLGCAFIDSPWTDGSVAQGAPPAPGLPAGLIANSASNAFATLTFAAPVTTPILLNTWMDYQ